MVIHLTNYEAERLKKYKPELYDNCYNCGKFFVPNDLTMYELEIIWPTKSLQLI